MREVEELRSCGGRWPSGGRHKKHDNKAPPFGHSRTATQQSRIQKQKGPVASRQRRLVVAAVCSRPPSKANSARPARVRHEQPEQPEHSQIHTTPLRSFDLDIPNNDQSQGRWIAACSYEKSHVVSGTARSQRNFHSSTSFCPLSVRHVERSNLTRSRSSNKAHRSSRPKAELLTMALKKKCSAPRDTGFKRCHPLN